MTRPAGISILGILAILGGSGTALLGVLLIAGSAFISTRTFTGMPLIAGIGAFGGIFLIVTGTLYIVVGIGLLKLANWARLLTMALAAVSLLFAVLAGGIVHFPIFWVFRRLVAAAIDVLILWYLCQPRIKQVFAPAPSATRTI